MLYTVTTTRGFREHIYTDECWCRPRPLEDCPQVVVHNDVTICGDREPRMTAFSFE